MKIPVDHVTGQERSELFEHMTEMLLTRVFPGGEVARHVILPRRTEGRKSGPASVDFLVTAGDGSMVVVETKAPYTDSPSYGVNRSIKRLKRFFQEFQDRKGVRKVVLALAGELPRQSAAEVAKAEDFFRRSGAQFEVWESGRIRSLLAQYYDVAVGTFSVAALTKVLAAIGAGPTVATATKGVGHASAKRRGLPRGETHDVVIVIADFCSYSKFVSASGGDGNLMRSIMGRFYRENRRILTDNGALVDKFLGDGVLAYWIPPQSATIIGKCVQEMIGLCLNLAEEWQEQVDLNVAPKGMRIGAAIGNITFIPERDTARSPIHAIGESINIAARLQATARPNSLAISNRLHTALFGTDGGFKELGPTTLKNIGEVLVWIKDYGSPRRS